MQSFSERLKQLRIEHKITQKSIANHLDIREQAYQKYEYGMREPNHAITIKLADYFNVSTDYLLGRTDNPTRN
jgi:transcriptional regulator with XRE-family HTH domain